MSRPGSEVEEAAAAASSGTAVGATERPRLRVERVPGPPVAAVRVMLAGGALSEEIPGQGLLTGRLLAEGTRRRDYRRLADDVEARGMLLHAGATFDDHGVALDALATDWEAALELAAELVREPAFDAERCAWLRRQTAAELDSLGDQPEVRTAWAFLDQLYHPQRRALPLQGSAASLATLTPADCAAFHQAALERGALVVVTGEVDEDAVGRRVEDLFAGLPAPPPPRAPQAPPPGRSEARRVVDLAAVPGDGEQAQLYLGHLTVERRHPDHDALALAAVVLGSGAGLSGRVPKRVREQEGLAYSASAQTVAGAGLDAGRLVLYCATSAATVERAETAARQELERFVEDGPLDDEVEDARSYLLGREPFRRETARQVADLLVRAEYLGLPMDRPAWRAECLRRVRRDDVAAAARLHLHPADLRVTVGLPAKPTHPEADG